MQLILLGYGLGWFFQFNNPWSLTLLFLFMIIVATHTVNNRVVKKFKGLKFISFGSLFLPSLVTGLYTFLLAVPQEPWFDISKTIPLFGMIIGNSLTGVSLSLDSLVNDLVTRRPIIEDYLALGATRFEAVRDLFVKSLTTGMTPILNSMNIVGLVSIPGMMTGQILAGRDPFEAAKYQIIIMFAILFVIFFSSVSAMIFTVLKFLDPNHRYRSGVVFNE